MAPLAGGTPVTVDATYNTAASIALTADGSNAYYAQRNYVFREPPMVGATLITLLDAGGSVAGIALDTTSIYFTDSTDGIVYSTTK
jgi:hypothetical protein